MAILEQSSGLAKLAVYRLLLKVLGPGTSRSRLYLMKGRIPTSIDLITEPQRFRKSDRLVVWNRSQLSVDQDGAISANASTAFQAGVANWFHFYRIDGDSVYQLIGTVGVTNSGKDLEFTTLNILNGTSYAIGNLGFELPAEFNDDSYFNNEPTPIYQLTVTPDTAIWSINTVTRQFVVVPAQATWQVQMT